MRAGNTEYLQNHYDDGFIDNQVSVDRQYASVEMGISKGRKIVYTRPDGPDTYRVLRLSAGWQYDRIRLAATSQFPDNPLNKERLYSYPYFELDLLQPDFIELSNLQLMESVEDIDVGHRVQTRIGFGERIIGQ